GRREGLCRASRRADRSPSCGDRAVLPADPAAALGAAAGPKGPLARGPALVRRAAGSVRSAGAQPRQEIGGGQDGSDADRSNVRGGMGPDPTSQRVQEDARKIAQLEADFCLEERGRAGGSRQSRGFDGSPPAERQTGPQGGEEDFTPRGSGLVASYQ